MLDTNVVSSLLSDRIGLSVETWASTQDERRFHLSVLTLAEFDKGIAHLPEGDPARTVYGARRNSLERRFAGRVLPLDDSTVRLWGEISGRVKRETGHPPPVVDTLIAATAIRSSLYLVTRNRRDVAHSGAVVFNPWEDDPANFELTSL